MEGTKQGGTSSLQDRTRQPRRAGGNSDAYDIESHNQKKALRVGILADGGVDKDKGTEKTWGAQRDQGGNCATESSAIEKHDQPKLKGKHYIGGKLVGEVPDVPTEVRVNANRDGGGNDPDGAHEKQGQKKGTHVSGGLHRLGEND